MVMTRSLGARSSGFRVAAMRCAGLRARQERGSLDRRRRRSVLGSTIERQGCGHGRA
jgi:hypothetical protein